ncbi:hypothetical protein C6Q22_25470 [Burkholderia multivorans]|nr:hypothetical protein C6Q08_28670 [Burkholderia multivorans]PRF81030.1 hypothetical protein C6Q22_25470 [Burkholderia multivorans]PRG24665.1 hypothetical protein C6Q35_11375 [Burkholderia multivorans]PRG77182.1 hypothetical protein C6T69_06585 [Burkholderia multivorans]
MVGVQPNPDRYTKATVRGGFFASARPGTRRDARIQRFVARKRSANIVENMQYPPSRRRAPTV